MFFSFQIEGLLWKLHNRKGFLSHVYILKWKFILWVFIEICTDYRIYSNKRRGAYLIFRARNAALIRGRRLFKHCTRQIYFFYIFIQRYIFYLLIFLWTDTKLIVNLELREKFTRWKKPESFMITRAKISAVRASGVRRLLPFLSQMRRLFEGGA